jgi:hypothetical protein
VLNGSGLNALSHRDKSTALIVVEAGRTLQRVFNNEGSLIAVPIRLRLPENNSMSEVEIWTMVGGDF